MKIVGKTKTNIQKISLSAMFLALGAVLPFLTGQIKEIGDTLLPMHFAVMLCGLVCGGKCGFAVGLMLPFLRSFAFGMPPLFPNAVWMSLELATYGLTAGFLYFSIFKNKKAGVHISLIISMLCGRIVWGVAKALLLGMTGKAFTFYAFLTEGFADALPGILIQIILIPLIIKGINTYTEKNSKR